VIHSFRKEAALNRALFWLTEAQFSKIEPHLPTYTRGKDRADDRRVISGIVHVLKSGGRWVDAPPEYGPRKTLYDRYVHWAAKGGGRLCSRRSLKPAVRRRKFSSTPPPSRRTDRRRAQKRGDKSGDRPLTRSAHDDP
jgi:transposase